MSEHLKEPTSEEIAAFLRGKLADAEAGLKFRVDSEKCWRGGTDKSWREVGCRQSKAERTKTAESHGRIAVKMRREVEMFKAVIAKIEKAELPEPPKDL